MAFPQDSFAVPFDVSGAGDHVLVAGTADKSTRIYRVVMTVSFGDDDLHDVVFLSGTTPLNGPLQMRSGGALTLEYNQRRWLATTAGQSFGIRLNANGRASGSLSAMVE